MKKIPLCTLRKLNVSLWATLLCMGASAIPIHNASASTLSSSSSHTTSSQVSHEVYSESGYISRENRFFTASRVRSMLSQARPICPYVQLGLEGMQSPTSSSPDPHSMAYLGVGLMAKHGPLALSTSLRHQSRSSVDDSPPYAIDRRISLFLGNTWLRSVLESDYAWLQEAYFESIFTSLDDNNVIASGFYRVGMRRSFSSFSVDLFAEPFTIADANRRFYNNRSDLKVSFRINLKLKNLVGRVSYSRAYDYSHSKDSPYRDLQWSYRSMFVIGGYI